MTWPLSSILLVYKPTCFLGYRTSVSNENCLFVCFWHDSPHWARAFSFRRFLDHKQRRTTGGRTPLDEWSARRRDLYLTKHNTHNRQTSMPPVWFKPTVSAGERPQTYALDRATTGTGVSNENTFQNSGSCTNVNNSQHKNHHSTMQAAYSIYS
jgi:hypothetical protein